MNEFRKKIMQQYYSQKDENGNPYESVEDIFDRVMSIVPPKHAMRNDLRAALENFDFVPSSPTLMNAGTELGQLSACFVLPLNDSISEIYDTIKDAALVHKTGGGTGFALSNIRSQGDLVHSTGGIASGPLSFMNVLNASTDTIKQGGKRRGANMAVMRVDHPSIMEFIKCKDDEGAFTNFNISVGITDKFVDALNGHGSDGNFGFDLVSPRTGKVVSTVNSRAIYSAIVDMAWKRGDPGLLFLDRINMLSPTREKIEATNPCGEIPLLPYEACNLGAINVGHCVVNGKVDYKKIDHLARLGTNFLNRVIDCNKLPIPAIQEATRATRKIGLGIMGFADLLYQLEIPYGSEESIKIARMIMCTINCASKLESTDLYYNTYNEGNDAVGFKNIFESGYEADLEHYKKAISQNIFYYNMAECFGANHPNEEEFYVTSLYLQAYEEHKYNPVINICRTTAAPTGTTGILADASGGVEPVIYLLTSRTVNGNEKHKVFNRYFEEYLDKTQYPENLRKSLVEELEVHGSIKHCPSATDEMKRIFVCAHDVSPRQHLKIMEAFQSYIDNSVSKTINLPESATVEDVKEVYAAAIAGRIKGLTIYRDGSRSAQVLTTVEKDKKSPSQVVATKAGSLLPRPRKRTLDGATTLVETGCGKLYVSVNKDECGIAEVFTGESNGCHAQSAVLSRLISIALRCGVDSGEIIEQLQSVPCTTAQRNPRSKCNSCPDAIARVMQMHLDNTSEPKLINRMPNEFRKVAAEPSIERKCPMCGEKLVASMGCNSNCVSCGWSGCN